jgi:hypothetical protein
MADAAPSFTAELMCVEDVIENELRQGCTQRSVALTYALALRSTWPTDWKRVNEAIAAKWPKGLDRVKTLAWRIMEHGPDSVKVKRGA